MVGDETVESSQVLLTKPSSSFNTSCQPFHTVVGATLVNREAIFELEESRYKIRWIGPQSLQDIMREAFTAFFQHIQLETQLVINPVLKILAHSHQDQRHYQYQYWYRYQHQHLYQPVVDDHELAASGPVPATPAVALPVPVLVPLPVPVSVPPCCSLP